MIVIAASAAFVGLIHSLAPGHWLPVVLMTKAKKWPLRMAAVGAFVAASGHILVSVVLGLAGVLVGAQVFGEHIHDIEGYTAWLLIGFGILYSVYSWKRHSHCHGHTHHGKDPEKEIEKKGPLVFLFGLGLSPCFAVLPVFAAAAPMGIFALFGTMLAFSLGVLIALVGGTVLVSRGLVKLDHPIFEHYGDVITGMGVSLMGVLLLILPHQH